MDWKVLIYKSTIILGNGFDLDLGLPTSYKQFANSAYWPIDNHLLFQSKLAQRLNDEKNLDKWLDLERISAEYAKPIVMDRDHPNSMIFPTLQSDKLVFENVRTSLSEYIKAISGTLINKESLAALLLQTISKYGLADYTFSFNYTNINAFCETLNIDKINYSHVHGACENNSAILGISDNCPIREGYDYLYKTCSPYYQSANVRYALQNSSLVLFYGHSLGAQDYHYFSNFFSQQSQLSMQEKDSKTIIIVTYDESSRMGILTQLRNMNDGRINYLFDCNDLRFYKTAEIDPKMAADDIFKLLEWVKSR